MLAYHFVGDGLRDGRPVPPDGEVLVHEGPLVMCSSGLHASRRLIDALEYAPGETLCRVKLGGEIMHDTDKMVARERTILWRLDAEEILRRFARKCALDVIHLWNPPEVVVRYLKTGDEAVRDAARAAAWDAAMAARAARAAARDAAWAAARAAARDAAWAAARAAARPARAARDARDAAWAAQNRRLVAMVATARRAA